MEALKSIVEETEGIKFEFAPQKYLLEVISIRTEIYVFI